MTQFDNLSAAVTDAIAEMVAVEALLTTLTADAVNPATVQAVADQLTAATAALTAAKAAATPAAPAA